MDDYDGELEIQTPSERALMANETETARGDGGSGGYELEDIIMNDAQQLKQAWINESCSPEVLEYKVDLVQRMASHIKSQEKFIEISEQDHEKALTRMIRFAELNRVKFYLRSYLRKRLRKIEAYSMHIFYNEISSRLSPQESDYAKEYMDAVNKLFSDCVLNRLPKNYDSIIQQSEMMESEVPDMIPSPDLQKHVFIKVKEDLGDIIIDEEDGTSINLQTHDIYAIQYKAIMDKLMQDQVALI